MVFPTVLMSKSRISSSSSSDEESRLSSASSSAPLLLQLSRSSSSSSLSLPKSAPHSKPIISKLLKQSTHPSRHYRASTAHTLQKRLMKRYQKFVNSMFSHSPLHPKNNTPLSSSSSPSSSHRTSRKRSLSSQKRLHSIDYKITKSTYSTYYSSSGASAGIIFYLVLFILILSTIILCCYCFTFSPRIPSSPFIRDLDPVLFEKLNSTHLLRERGFDFYSTNPYDLPPRVGFINRHFGCHSDFTHLSKQLGFNFTEFSVDELYRHALPWLDVHDWLSEKEANFDSFHNLADLFCSRFDLVVVADINPDARFLLQRIDKEPHTCGIKKIVMQTTNRFNYYNRLPTLDSEETLLSLFARVSSRTIGPDIEWVANNPWEKPYAQVKYSSTRALNYTQVIRPFGHFNHESATLHREAPASKNSVGVSSSVSSNNSTSNQKISVSTSSSNSSGDIVVSPHDAQFAVVRNEGLNHGFYDLLVANNVPVLPIKQKYGGPTVLAQYKAFIELPYQVSTMKYYENLAHGVRILIPTPRLFKELLNQHEKSSWWNPGPKGLDFWGLHIMNFKPEHLGPDWIAKMDYYHVDFKDYVQYFDSLSELKAMLTVEMPMSKRQSQIEMYQRVRFKSLKQWSSVLNITIPAKFIS